MINGLLVEILTEELPPKVLDQLSKSLANSVFEFLERTDFTEQNSTIKYFATPRRLAFFISDVRKQSPKRIDTLKLLPYKVGIGADGKPTPSLIKKLRKLEIDDKSSKDIKKINDGKLDMLVIEKISSGQKLTPTVQKALEEAIKSLPIPKIMNYQLGRELKTIKFIRPAHGLIVLHGERRLSVSLLGLKASRSTKGHRFLGSSKIIVNNAKDYENILEKKGRVIADFNKRKRLIEDMLQKKASKLNAKISNSDALLEEVTALVEWPEVYAATFDTKFLKTSTPLVLQETVRFAE